MIAYRKKLIEVALPLDAINAEAAREKSIRHGHPSTLHLWWARRPLAACRAVLFASLVDDPGNDLPDKEAEAERKRLFGIIEQLVLWENVNDERVLHMARIEIARSVARAAGVTLPAGDLTPAQVREALEQYAPPVLDPFAGGGSIPLEAQRLGLKAYASDLNPVAVLINKALIEIPPKFAGKPPVHPGGAQMALAADDGKKVKSPNPPFSQWKGAAGLAEDVRYYGAWMRAEAEKRIGHLYPKGPNGETVIAWLWARTVKCPNPACGATMPLVRSFALSTKKGKETWVEPQIDKHAKNVGFKVKSGKGKPSEGTVNRRGARCIVCDQPVPFDHVRAEGRAGRMGAQLMAIVTEGERGRNYYAPVIEHEAIARSAQPTWKPQTDLPEKALSFRVQLYGMTHHADLFTKRQLTALATLSDLVSEAHEQVLREAQAASLSNEEMQTYADAVATYLGLAVSRSANTLCSLTVWSSSRDQSVNVFSRQALPMNWDFPEVNPFAGAAGDFGETTESMARSIEAAPATKEALVSQRDATTIDPSEQVIFATDPPYYDNIGYADLSDFFYVWLRRSLSKVYPELFSTLLVPKAQELIAAPYRHDGDRSRAEEFFEEGLGQAFTKMRAKQHHDYPLTVYYAFKQAESDEDSDESERVVVASTGWETMLEGLIKAGFTLNGTWPMRTERPTGVKVSVNALASSIVLVCRPRLESAPLATRREFVNALKKELPAALTKLMHGGIAPVDLAQASIGPGMAVFSRYAKVMEADGQAMPVRTALQLINQHLDEYLTAEDSELDKDTRFALAWFQQFGHDEGPFGDADVLARAKDTSVAGMVQAGVLHSRAGKVRLLRRNEFAKDWDPRTDARLTVWECAQNLIRRLNEKGEDGAAALVKQMGGGRSEDARALAYRLYAICERKKWADEALAYNALVVSWPEIEKKATQMESEEEQGRLL
jgi:putative DNA methylase